MSIATEISRIQADRNTIRTKLVELGLATSTDKLDALAAAVEGLVNQGAVSVEILEGNTYAIPAGYHNGSGVVKAMTDAAGDALRYKTQAKTVTPTKSQQSVTPDSGYYALESVTVNAIPEAYQDVSDVTATAGSVLSGKIFVDVDGTVVVGTMPNVGAVDVTLSATNVFYNVPHGAHNGYGKVKVVIDEKEATPTKETQVIYPDTGKVLGAVQVNPIPKAYQDVTGVTATADDVIAGRVFVNADGEAVDGTIPFLGSHNAVLSPSRKTYTIEKGYHNGYGEVWIELEQKSVIPTKDTQIITPSANKVLSEVTVDPIPAAYQDVTGVTATGETVLAGSKFVDAEGNLKDGAVVVREAATYQLDGLTTTSFTVPAGFHGGNTSVALTDDIENALAAI